SQWNDVVLGLEFNYMHGKFGGSQTDSVSRFFSAGGGYTDNVTYQAVTAVQINDMATLRARARYAVGVFLPYVFGGLAIGQANIVRTLNVFGDQINPNVAPPFNDVPFFLTASDTQNQRLIHGYSVGAGADMMVYSCLFLRAEWEYVKYAAAIDTTVNTFRVGLGYKF